MTGTNIDEIEAWLKEIENNHIGPIYEIYPDRINFSDGEWKNYFTKLGDKLYELIEALRKEESRPSKFTNIPIELNLNDETFPN